MANAGIELLPNHKITVTVTISKDKKSKFAIWPAFIKFLTILFLWLEKDDLEYDI